MTERLNPEAQAALDAVGKPPTIDSIPSCGSENQSALATDPKELERQIMDPNVPKNEREWWAAREIEKLQDLLLEEDGK
jgi:hypothetical protein